MKNTTGYLIIAYLSLFIYGLIDNSRGPAYPFILGDFNITNAKGSQIFALSSLAGLIMIIFGRLWLRRLGELGGQRIFLLMVSAGSLGMGFSDRIGGYSLMLISSVILGLGLGGTNISTNILVAFGSSERNRRRVYSGLHSMYGVASVLAPMAFGLAMRSGVSWEDVFLFLSIFPLIVFFTSLSTNQVRHDVVEISSPPSFGIISRIRIGLCLSLYVAAEVAISSRLVLFMTRTSRIDPAEASIYLSIFFVLLLSGRLSFFLFQFPWSSYRLMLISVAASIILFMVGVLMYPIALSLCGLTMSYFFPCGMEWISKRFGEHTNYMMTSVMASVAIILIAMHWGVGVVTDLAGIRAAMILGPASLICTACLLIISRKDFKSKDGASI